MSPASQGNLEVERYIGSCLISSTVRGSNLAGKNSGAGSHNLNHKGKNHRTNTCPEHHHYGPPMGPGGYLPLCECGSLKFGGARYGPPGRSGWTGMPLISMASPNPRRNRKQSAASNNTNINAAVNKHVKASVHQSAVNTTISNKISGVDIESGNQRTPLSRLAIHTQGAPLILSGRYNAVKKNNCANNRVVPARQLRGGELLVRRCNGSSAVRDGGTVNSATNNNNTPSSDCLSVASDESSGHSENSLPRIIKPRKRRKKDRKPTPTTNNPSCSSDSNIPASAESKAAITETPSIATLKPYIPLCYELYDGGHWNRRGSPRSVEATDSRRRTWEADARQKPRPRLTETAPEDEHVSEDDTLDPKLHHEFDDVVEEEDGVLQLPCPPTVCQCRYCDPAGLIWDVDQHCYSPFLTPPSPTLDIYPNIPLLLNAAAADFQSFNLFNKDSVLLLDGEGAGTLRHSWSEPSRDSYRAEFGVIGGGKACVSNANNNHHSSDFSLKPVATRLVSTSSESSYTSTSASQGLEVSTEIVTSPNGHRDIEIKFYSSSPPTNDGSDSARTSVSEGDVWGNTASSVWGDTVWPGEGETINKGQQSLPVEE